MRIVGTHFDLTARKEAEALAERQRAEQARTEWLTRLVFAQEDERRRIAREMHDQFGEQLTALARRIERLKEAANGRPEMAAPIEALEDVARQLDRDVEQLVWELRPTALDDLGLRAALDNYVRNWSQREGIPAELHTVRLARRSAAVGDGDDALSNRAGGAHQRGAAFARHEGRRHPRAARRPGGADHRGQRRRLRSVADAGGPLGFGLVGMQERAALVGAQLQIESAPGEGHDRAAAAAKRRRPTPAGRP